MDEKIILTKIDEMNSYLDELDQIKPDNLKEYVSSIKDKRACERLLQIVIETALDICNIITSQLKLGLPSDEEEVFSKLTKEKIISTQVARLLSEMKGFRNVLVHKYAKINDELVFENLGKLEDFEKFKEEIMLFLKKKK